MSDYHIYAIGNALVDKEFEVTDQFLAQSNIDKGVMTLVEEDYQEKVLDQLKSTFGLKKRASGGSAANTIIAASYFGSNCFYSCKVGNDEPGEFYLHDLNQAGVISNASNHDEAGTTGRCVVMVTPDAERTMHSFLGISQTISEQELNIEALKRSEYLYLEGYLVTSDSARQAAVSAKKIADQEGIKTALTFSDPGMVEFFKDGLKEMLSDGVDLLFCNEQEAKTWSGKNSLEEIANELKKIAKTFVITLGAKGSLIFDGDTLHTIEGVPVKAVDTNGAGDMYAGAFIYALTHGHNYAEAGRLATCASAEVVSHFGPRLPKQAHQQLLDKVAL